MELNLSPTASLTQLGRLLIRLCYSERLKAVLKFAAELIASMAQMAAVQAVYENRTGSRMEGLFWFTGNPQYQKAAAGAFLSAGVFGTIAGGCGGCGSGRCW